MEEEGEEEEDGGGGLAVGVRGLRTSGRRVRLGVGLGRLGRQGRLGGQRRLGRGARRCDGVLLKKEEEEVEEEEAEAPVRVPTAELPPTLRRAKNNLLVPSEAQ